MSWRDKLQQGKFRNAPFFWKSAETDLGRRTARHDYPFRDDAFFEDMGKVPREFTLEMYVIGADYMEARDLLARAFEAPGPATLVHPTLGTLKVVVCGRVKLREATDEGGMARFTATFVLAGDNKFPTAVVDTVSAVSGRASQASDVALAAFASSFTVAAKPGFIKVEAISRLRSIADTIQGIANRIPTDIDTPQLLQDARAFASSVSSLITRPLDLARNMVSLLDEVAALGIDPLARFGIHQGMFDLGWDWAKVTPTTPSRILEAANQAVIVDLVRQAAVIGAALTATEIDFPSYQDAVVIRDQLGDALDGLMEVTLDDAVYVALADLRAAVVVDISTRGADLVRIVQYTPAQTLPALVLSYRLYGDADKADALLSRNNISHPGFVPGGKALEVTTDV
jgi:prophage DNA circulation protein